MEQTNKRSTQLILFWWKTSLNLYVWSTILKSYIIHVIELETKFFVCSILFYSKKLRCKTINEGIAIGNKISSFFWGGGTKFARIVFTCPNMTDLVDKFLIINSNYRDSYSRSLLFACLFHLSSCQEKATVLALSAGRIRIRLGVVHFRVFQLFLWLFTTEFAACLKSPSRDNHRKAPYPRTQQRVQ